MDKIKIFVACHKPAELRDDANLVPIHVGRVISQFKEEMSYMIGDDTDDNISEKNPFYSEMTAQYWVWKNFHDSEYVGFCHYRRYFVGDFSDGNVDRIFKNGSVDVIMNEPVLRPNNRYRYLVNYISGEDRYIMQKVIRELYPDYYDDFLRYSHGYFDYVCNMFICKKELFDAYAEWIFAILTECEKYIKLPAYTRGRRVFGYISEFLMPVYFMHNKKKIATVPYQDKYGNIVALPLKTKWKIKLKTRLDRRSPTREIKLDSSIEAGLKFDGII